MRALYIINDISLLLQFWTRGTENQRHSQFAGFTSRHRESWWMYAAGRSQSQGKSSVSFPKSGLSLLSCSQSQGKSYNMSSPVIWIGQPTTFESYWYLFQLILKYFELLYSIINLQDILGPKLKLNMSYFKISTQFVLAFYADH